MAASCSFASASLVDSPASPAPSSLVSVPFVFPMGSSVCLALVSVAGSASGRRPTVLIPLAVLAMASKPRAIAVRSAASRPAELEVSLSATSVSETLETPSPNCFSSANVFGDLPVRSSMSFFTALAGCGPLRSRSTTARAVAASGISSPGARTFPAFIALSASTLARTQGRSSVRKDAVSGFVSSLAGLSAGRIRTKRNRSFISISLAQELGCAFAATINHARSRCRQVALDHLAHTV
jgi:hypothetical protein